MLIGMADESGFQTGGYFGMTGYLADHDVWAELNPLWNEALKKNGAPYLRMKELSGQPNGVYNGAPNV